MKNCYDLIIVGGGPAGLSAAFAAQKLDLNYLIIEREQIAATIENYPLGKILFSTTNELEFEPNTLQITGAKPTREEMLAYYKQFAYQQHHLAIHTNENVENIKAGEPLTVITNLTSYQAKTVLVAVGGMGIVNKLNVKGETPERISYMFREAAPYHNKHVLVVGGGNSAAETMLDLCEAGAQATLILRRASLDSNSSKTAAIKPWVRQPLEKALQEGKLKILFNAEIIEILPDTAIVEVNKEKKELLCDHIFALIGTRPDISLLVQAGVEIGIDKRPLYNTDTYETNLPNLFVVGHLTRELHMKNATQLPPKIVQQIALKIKNNTQNQQY
jgi:thioredoxin reductase (NADPH)